MLCTILTYNTHGLPWSRNTTREICDWLKTLQPSIICLQEVFVEAHRNYYKEQLQRYGYHVVIPRDGDTTWLGSGLLTAFLESDYMLRSECFCSYQDYHNVECFANKGFLSTTLYHKSAKRSLQVINTHTQSNTEVSVLFGNDVIRKIQRKQFQQIVDYTTTKIPTVIVGDFNCEESPNPYVRFLKPLTQYEIRKSTFYSTGEDLDHVGWIPLQWARDGCGYCDISRRGPRMESCTIFQKPWSDHAPMFVSIYLPILE
jgi:endonuclease/exonuclease/phosphatase family metal-dependent hydrolase